MKNEMNTRQLREAAHQHKYEVVKGDSCTYCGAKVNSVGQGSAGDHVPPLAVLDANFGIPVGDMKIVPCCSECNTKLGASTLVTTDLRRSHIINSRPYLGKSESQIIAQATYNAVINEGFKRGEGQIDTPDVMAEQILDKLPLLGSLCDPACGDGSFVRMQIKRLLEAGVSHEWIEDNIRGYDIDAEMVAEAIRRLRRDFPGLNGKVIFKQKDIFEMNERFTTIIMNPPWTLKQGGKVFNDVWKKFADAALKLAETVVVVAPMAAKRHDRKVLLEEIRFDGVDHSGCVVVWSEEQKRDFSIFPKFDLSFQMFKDGKGIVSDRRKTDKTTVAITNWKGERFWVTPSLAKKCGFGERKLMMRFKSSGKHDAHYGESLLAMCFVMRGKEAELQRWEAYSRTPEGLAALKSAATQQDVGFIAPTTPTMNAAFSSRHQK